MPLDIHLLCPPDKFQEKRKEVGVSLREKRIRALVSRINIVSHRELYNYEELEEKIRLYSKEEKEIVEFGVVDKIQIPGDPIDWIEKIAPPLIESGLIEKTKCYVSPQEINRLKEIINNVRQSIGEGEQKEIEEERFGVKVTVKEGIWSRFWDALEYCVDLCSAHDLFLYIPTLEAFFEKI